MIRSLSAATALGLALLALLAAADTTIAERSDPKPAKCVKGWNAGANSAAQQKLLGIFADGGLGNVIVGSEDGKCVLAAYNVNKPNYLIFTRSGNAYAKTGKGPGDQFEEYRASINPLDVILRPSGKVKPVPQ